MDISQSQSSFWKPIPPEELLTLRTDAHKSALENASDIAKSLTLEDELILLRHYEKEIREFCSRPNLSFPDKIKVNYKVTCVYDDSLSYCHILKQITALNSLLSLQGIAIIYMKRFYLFNSVLEHHPKIMMYFFLLISAFA